MAGLVSFSLYLCRLDGLHGLSVQLRCFLTLLTNGVYMVKWMGRHCGDTETTNRLLIVIDKWRFLCEN